MTDLLDLAQKLQRSNDTARQVFGDGYEAAVDSWRKALKTIMAATGSDIAHATILALQRLPIGSGGAALMIAAASVDLMQDLGEVKG